MSPLVTPLLSSPTLAPTLPEWTCQEQRGSGLTAPAFTNGVQMATTAACGGGVEQQTVDHVVLHWPIH